MTQAPPPPPGHGFDPANPKASAKAAKAYAKASRPWFKKKRFIIPLAIVGIAVIATAAGGGGDDKGSQKADPPTSASQKTDNNSGPSTGDGKAPSAPAAEAPDNSSKGKGAITWGNWEVVGKLQVSNDGLNDYDVVARVKNVGDSVDSGIFTVTILKGQTILGTADCTTSDVNPGAVATANCFSTDSFTPGWTEITIEDTF